MKKMVLLLVLMACSVGWTATKYCSPAGAGTHAGTVGNEYTLPEAKIGAGVGDTVYMAAGTYTLAANLSITSSTTWIPQGNVIIDCDNTYTFDLSNNNPTTGPGGIIFGDSTYTYTITVTKSAGAGLGLANDARSSRATLYNIIATANALNGICGYDGYNAAFNLEVICHQCKSYANLNDGFSLIGAGTAPTNGADILYLDNCEGYSNGNADNDQGFTAHSPYHRVYAIGGSYHDNTGPGAEIVTGAVAVCDNVLFYNNGTSTASQIVLGATAGTSFIATRCKFYGPFAGTYCADLSGIGIQKFTDCEFIGTATAEALIHVGASATAAIFDRCIFRDLTTANKYAISVESTNVTGFLSLRNCVFNNNTCILTSAQRTIEMVNNIFSNNISSIGINLASQYGYPYLYGLTGYNDFYNNGNDFYQTGAGFSAVKQSTDLAVNPQFVDAANGDFRLLPSSPLLNAGVSVSGKGKNTIGTWQPYSTPNPNNPRNRYSNENIYK